MNSLKINNKLKLFIRAIEFQYLASKVNLVPEEAFIIAGDPRGGTTWLAEIIASIPNTEIIWEPLWLQRESTFKKLNFAQRQYIPENASWPEAHDNFRMLFSGKILNNHLCQFSNPKKIKKAKYLLFKFCRANQLLPWLVNNFNFKYQPIYLIRNPFAVISSQLQQGGWDQLSPLIEIPLCRYQEFYMDHKEFLRKVDSKVKKLATIWCLCNLIPLKHPKNNIKWITITYESLLKDGANQLLRIEKRWNCKLPESAFERLNKASKTTIDGSPIISGKSDQLSYWQKQLSTTEIEEILFVLDYFNIHIYNEQLMPLVEFD